jgi:cellulose synthase operon protein C
VTEALAHLEPAAAALSNDPLVQFHLGMAYVRADRRRCDPPAPARDRLAGPADTRPQFQKARAEIARLQRCRRRKRPTERGAFVPSG